MSSDSSVNIEFPDGSVKSYRQPVTVMDVAQSVSPSLAKKTIAGLIDNKQVDACDLIEADCKLRILTSDDEESLTIIRHSCAHLVGHAVKQLYPAAQMVIGPVIDNGFYYDIAYERPFTPDDVAAIQQRMKELIAQDYPVIKKMTPRNDVIDAFKQRGERYKLRLIDDMPDVENMALYYHQEYIDMCRGPHVPSTKFLKAFSLTGVSGSYWRGDSSNESLQRIYGTAWADSKSLQQYLKQREEAAKRDHRKLGRELDLFHFHEDAPGSVFWHPRGWQIFRNLLSFMRRRQNDSGYIEVNSPDVMDRSLWMISGHWDNYRDHMFTSETEDGRSLALKPMNCPGSVLMFAHGLKSYRDLPIRMAEFGKVHRYEPSGSLHGLMRVRHFTQDDAHIYCTADQIDEECRKVIALNLSIYRQLGFSECRIKLSTRPENRIGDDALWDLVESALANALGSMDLAYELQEGEGAFYGPKLEFSLRDAIGREWQCGTLQLDMNLPDRFGIEYVDETGIRCRPVMLHRALFGSLERFIGILLEHYAGWLPAWLSPVQVVVMSITEAHADYAGHISDWLCLHNIRSEADIRNEKVGYKIREQTLQRVPFILIAGAKECEDKTISVRTREGTDLGNMPLNDALELIHKACLAPDHQAREASVRALEELLSDNSNSEGIGNEYRV